MKSTKNSFSAMVIPENMSIKEKNELLMKYYPHYPTKQLSKAFGMEAEKVYSMAARMKVKKNAEYLDKELQRQAQRLRVAGKPHRFKKGIIPHNKGKKITPEQYEQCAPTMFKKGQKSHNEKANGYISWRKDKRTGLEYAWVRMDKQQWRLYHRVLWEKERGKIPRGHVLFFRDGNTRNVTLDNLEMITMAENMRRNSYLNNYPKELAQVIQLRGALNRRIRNMEKKAEKQKSNE